MKKSIKIEICVLAGLVVAGGVCVGLVLHDKNTQEAHERRLAEYRALDGDIANFSRDQEKVKEFLEMTPANMKLNNDEKKIVEGFEKAAAKSEAVNKLASHVACSDENVKRLVNEAIELYENIHTLYLVEQDLSVVFDGELSKDDLMKLKESSSDYLKQMATDLGDYQTKVQKLSAKDKDFEKKYKELVEEGKKLEKKYTNVKLEAIAGASKEEILAFYDKIGDLRDYLMEQDKK